MGENTQISWTDATWPVARGCDKISPGCKFCWAIKDAHRMRLNPNPKIAAHFQGLTQIEGGKPNWSGVSRIDESIIHWPLKWRKAKRIFVASSGDLFHEALSDDDIDVVFAVMAVCPRHIFQVLTKRAERAAQYLLERRPKKWDEHGLQRTMPGYACRKLRQHFYGGPYQNYNWVDGQWPLPNVQVGFSAETQPYFDARWEHMKKIAAAGWMTWLSYEPALGPLDIRQALTEGLSWCVCGGESAAGARPMHPDWARGVRDQCVEAGTPFHFKQWGQWAPGILDIGDSAAGMRSVGKKKSGRVLDGRTWDEMPVREYPR